MRRSIKAMAAASVLVLAGCGMAQPSGQIVHKDPDTTAQAFHDAFAEGAYNGASQFSGLWHGGMQTFVEQPDRQHLDVIVKFDGVTATEDHFLFTPKDEGKSTLVTVDVKVDRDVMKKAFEGTEHAQLGTLPTSAFETGMQRQMAKYAERIEQGTMLNRPSEGWMTPGGDPPPEFYEGMPDDMRQSIKQQEQEDQQQAATAPTVDPSAAARAYLHPSH